MKKLPESLRSKIEEAFNDVTLGDGVGLRQARAMDDYENEKVQKQARLKDEKDDWRAIPLEDLEFYYSSPSFFDADGMRFHLPAYMLSDEYRDNSDTLTFHLTNLNDYGKSQFSSLTNKQRAAVTGYLYWLAEQQDFLEDSEEIRNSISSYWSILKD